MPCAGINGNPFHDISWLAYERDIPSDATSSRSSNLPAPKPVYFGSEDRLALQNLQIPVGSTNRTVPEWLFPRRFPTKQRLTTSRPDAILVTVICLLEK